MAAASKSRSRAYSGASPDEAMVADLIALLEQGSTPWRRPWDATGSGVHCNVLSGHI